MKKWILKLYSKSMKWLKQNKLLAFCLGLLSLILISFFVPPFIWHRVSYVAEGFALTSKVRVESEDFYEKNKRFPMSNAEVGLPEANQITGVRVRAIEILPEGKIVIHYFDPKNSKKLQILLKAQVENGKINWICSDNPQALDHFEQKYLPAICRDK